MKIIIKKKETSLFIVDENEQKIETYSFEQEINFKNLTSFLLKQNLSEKMEFIDSIKSKSEAEENLINIIKNIIINYNKKVE